MEKSHPNLRSVNDRDRVLDAPDFSPMTFLNPLRRKRYRDAAERLYGAIVAQARDPAFYLHCGVPDTVEGRFDMISLHAYLVLRRLRGTDTEAKAVGQELFDLMFADMDRNLREMGTGDLGVGRKVKALAKAFYGRIRAYDAALAGRDQDLATALGRNLFGDPATPERYCLAMADYLRREDASAAMAPLDDIKAGRIRFGPPPSDVAAAS
jgi:cytochrome b pre-mRNA-processing protein 3